MKTKSDDIFTNRWTWNILRVDCDFYVLSVWRLLLGLNYPVILIEEEGVRTNVQTSHLQCMNIINNQHSHNKNKFNTTVETGLPKRGREAIIQKNSSKKSRHYSCCMVTSLHNSNIPAHKHSKIKYFFFFFYMHWMFWWTLLITPCVSPSRSTF